jgi:ABC-type dipeptide/oligopeptide/nickel transport system permease component
MTAFFLARALRGLLVGFGVLTVVFFVGRLTGDPVAHILGANATPADIAEFRRLLGFDRPLFVQYFVYVGSVLQGDLGRSFQYHSPVLPLVLERIPATAQLTFAAMTVALAIAIPTGLLAAMRPGSLVDALAMLVAVLGQAIPVFWLGMMLTFFFSLKLGLLPPAGRAGPAYLVLPAVTLGAYSAATIARLTRSCVLDVLSQDYIRTARSKGLNERSVIVGHALKNAAIPVVTMVGLQLGTLLGGAVVIETVFAWPGVGDLAVRAIAQRDFPLVQAAVLMVALGFVGMNLLVDLVYLWIDPRIRYR